MRLVNLLDDFALGGVSRALGLFASPQIAALADCRIEAVAGGAILAKAYDAELVVVHFPPSWRRLAWAAGLRWRLGAGHAVRLRTRARFRGARRA